MTSNNNNEMDFRFLGKYIIETDIKLKTGLHIGGTEEGFDIGGIDNPVIKDKVTGLPYIPGSSLKGKIRSLLEWAHNKVKLEKNPKTQEWEGKLCTNPIQPIGIVFGIPAENHKNNVPGPTRLTVRDSLPDDQQIKIWQDAMGENIYTEAKTENAIDRLTSAANPRSMERVPSGSVFKAEFVYDVYKEQDVQHLRLLFEGMRLLEDSYLGGGGTRGSGKVEFANIIITARDRSFYIGVNDSQNRITVDQNGHNTASAILDHFNMIFKIA